MSQPVVLAGWLNFSSLPPKLAMVALVVTEDIVGVTAQENDV
jgi:hypothetical protein